MLQNFTKCYKTLQNVTKRYKILLFVLNCYKLLQTVTYCYKLLQTVTNCYKLLQTVTNCYKLLQTVTNCYKLLQNVTKCYKMMQKRFQYWAPLRKFVCTRYFLDQSVNNFYLFDWFGQFIFKLRNFDQSGHTGLHPCPTCASTGGREIDTRTSILLYSWNRYGIKNRVARFLSPQLTKTGRMYQITLKYTQKSVKCARWT
jgi:hypothetical protein